MRSPNSTSSSMEGKPLAARPIAALVAGPLSWFDALRRWASNVRVSALFCEDYPTLNDRQISKMHVEFPAWLGQLLTAGVRILPFGLSMAGESIALRNLDDPSKYYSAEFAAIAVDELTRHDPLSCSMICAFACAGQALTGPKFGAGTNPGGARSRLG